MQNRRLYLLALSMKDRCEREINRTQFETFLVVFRVVLSCIVGSLRDREVACSASDRQGSNFESCVWRTVSSQSSHHPQEVLLAQFSLYVHKGGLKPDSFHFHFVLSWQWYYLIVLAPANMHACHARARKQARNSPIRENPLPANKKLNQCSPNIGHRLRRWPSIEPALGQCIVFAGIFPMQNRRDAWYYLRSRWCVLCFMCFVLFSSSYDWII